MKCRVVSLDVRNFLRVRAVHVVPGDERIVPITGPNGAGKSSVLRAIAVAVGGGRQCPEKPIRRGADAAEIRLDLGEYSLVWRATKSGERLEVKDRDGNKVPAQQSVLDKLYTDLTFDPLAFPRLPAPKQVEVLKRVAGLDGEFAQIDAKKAAAIAARAEANREHTQAEARLAALPDEPGPDEETSVAAIMERGNIARDQNAKHAKQRAWLAENEKKIADTKAVLVDLQSRIVAEHAKLTELQALDAQYRPTVEALVDVDLEALQREAIGIESKNAVARRRKARASALVDVKGARIKALRAERAVEDINAEREAAIAAAKMPVPGLGFSDDGVTLNGVPFAQASTAEQIRAGVAMGMASNPSLRVMLIKDGSLLDAKSLALLEALAEEYDAQIWLERVSDDATDGFAIEDGSLVNEEVTQ